MSAGLAAPPSRAARLRRLEALGRENAALNAREFDERRIVLASTPQTVFLQINAPCNADCVFCSKGYDYPLFSLDEYLARFGAQVTPVLRRASRLILTGSGEFLGVPGAAEILARLNADYPHVEKFIATNASHLSPRVVELLTGPDSRYTLQLSLHAADRRTHEAVMRYDAYDRVLGNVRRLMARRGEAAAMKVQFMFVMNSLNAEGLPEFVRFAAREGADRVTAGYFYVYEAQQKYLSMYFHQPLANRMIDEARSVAAELGLPIALPPKFGEPRAPAAGRGSCGEAWHQVMLNPDGAVLPCDLYGAFHETLARKSFADIWNGPAYRSIRRALKAGAGCLATCPRHNPAAVDDWAAHVIHRPKEPAQIVKEYREALRKP